jgi:hypothetical protein
VLSSVGLAWPSLEHGSWDRNPQMDQANSSATSKLRACVRIACTGLSFFLFIFLIFAFGLFLKMS